MGIRPHVLGLVASLLGLLAGVGGAQIVFTDISAQSGIDFDGLLTESVAWGDFDNDGDEDLYLTNNGPNRLFRNEGGGSFTDVTATAGVGHPGFSVGTAFGDLDNDGDLDLYVVSFGTGPDVLYRNDGPVEPSGEWQFTDVAEVAGVAADESSSRGVAFLDYDRDGLLDIYVNAIGDDILYRNLGSLTFSNQAGPAGITGVGGQGVGVVATDVDGDGWIDLFTGNRTRDPNVLFLNNGNGTFTDITASAGIDQVGLGMGVLAFDYDNDLDIDLYWTSWPDDRIDRPNALYEQTAPLGGGPTFLEVAATSGTGDVDGWGISCNAGDIDNDGWQDFVVTNGFSDTTSPNVLFHNNANGTFTDITAVLGGGDFDGRGTAFADFDDDGDLDLVLTADADVPTRLWRNDTVHSNRWLTLVLTGSDSNRSAIGARIEVTTDLGTTLQEVSGGAGRGSQNSLPVEFGLGPASAVETVRIAWPSGTETLLTGVAMNQKRRVFEGLFANGFESGDASGWSMVVP